MFPLSVYFSSADAVLALSAAVNLGAKRLGHDGPHDRYDTAAFPSAEYRMVACSVVLHSTDVCLNGFIRMQ